jgi:hypothetical protein
MQNIIPHSWFDKEAVEAAEFYVSVFPNSKITNITQLHNTPSGDVDTVKFEVMGFEKEDCCTNIYRSFYKSGNLGARHEFISKYAVGVSGLYLFVNFFQANYGKT